MTASDRSSCCDRHRHQAPPASGCLFVLAAPSGGGKTSLVARAARARAGHPPVGLVHDARAAPGRAGRRRLPLRRRARRSWRSRPPASSSSTRYVHGNWYATSATWLRAAGRRGPRRAARDRLAGRGAGAQADPRRGADLHPAAVARSRCEERLEKRGQDAPEVIARRLDAAREEMRHCGEFDYVIMNQDFARAVDDLSVIVRAARLAAPRQQVRHAAAHRRTY